MATGAILLALLIGGWFFLSLKGVHREATQQGRQQLEDALRRAAVACYAAEGVYPPDVDYLIDHYGISFDAERYAVFYEVFAENLMPEITVVERNVP